jgi:hypothetical protein
MSELATENRTQSGAFDSSANSADVAWDTVPSDIEGPNFLSQFCSAVE